jgi:hypothetical protein
MMRRQQFAECDDLTRRRRDFLVRMRHHIEHKSKRLLSISWRPFQPEFRQCGPKYRGGKIRFT